MAFDDIPNATVGEIDKGILWCDVLGVLVLLERPLHIGRG